MGPIFNGASRAEQFHLHLKQLLADLPERRKNLPDLGEVRNELGPSFITLDSVAEFEPLNLYEKWASLNPSCDVSENKWIDYSEKTLRVMLKFAAPI